MSGLPQRKTSACAGSSATPDSFSTTPFLHQRLDASRVPVEMRVLIGPRDAGDVGEIRPQPGQAFEFAAITQVPAKTRAVQDHEPALGLTYQHRSQHRKVRRQTRPGGDEHHRLARRNTVQRKHAAGLRSEKQRAAMLQCKQARRELAAGDEREIKLHITALHAGRRDAVRAADHLVRLGNRFLRRRFRHARFTAEQTQHRELAGLEIEHRSVGLDAEDQQLRIDFLPPDDGGIVRIFVCQCSCLGWENLTAAPPPSSAASWLDVCRRFD